MTTVSDQPAAIGARVHVVLCNPQDVRNVAGCIRAVANHGLASLRVVTHRNFAADDLFHFSSEAMPKIDVQFVRTLDEALAGLDQILGTSRRTRDTLSAPYWPAAGLAGRFTLDGEVGILFGNERTGLTADEVDRCSALVYMPTHERMPSVNLSHAVACIGYELARPNPEGVGPTARPPEKLRAPPQAIEAFYAHVREIAGELGYPPGRNPVLFARRLRRLLDRANPSPKAFSMLAGVFSEMRWMSRRTQAVEAELEALKAERVGSEPTKPQE
jgi:tRNA/rRNA methyltransferase/tRNA (cytidine32/uridine32-2'-O)-methyltransferase